MSDFLSRLADRVLGEAPLARSGASESVEPLEVFVEEEAGAPSRPPAGPGRVERPQPGPMPVAVAAPVVVSPGRAALRPAEAPGTAPAPAVTTPTAESATPAEPIPALPALPASPVAAVATPPPAAVRPIIHAARPAGPQALPPNQQPPNPPPPNRQPPDSHPTEPNRRRTPEARQPQLPAVPPVIRVTIGRVEVRAVTQTTPAAAPRPRADGSPVMTLEEYLRDRSGGGQR